MRRVRSPSEFQITASVLSSIALRTAAVSLARSLPNPATDKLRLDRPEAPIAITAIDATGRTMHLQTFRHTGRILEVDVSSVPPGLCVLLLKANSGNLTLRFINE